MCSPENNSEVRTCPPSYMRSSSLIWTTLVFQPFMHILLFICLHYQYNTTVMFTLKSLFKIAAEDSTLIDTSLSLLSMFVSSDFCNIMKSIRNKLQQTQMHAHTHISIYNIQRVIYKSFCVLLASNCPCAITVTKKIIWGPEAKVHSVL